MKHSVIVNNNDECERNKSSTKQINTQISNEKCGLYKKTRSTRSYRLKLVIRNVDLIGKQQQHEANIDSNQ